LTAFALSCYCKVRDLDLCALGQFVVYVSDLLGKLAHVGKYKNLRLEDLAIDAECAAD
jgi:hypothetical protein